MCTIVRWVETMPIRMWHTDKYTVAMCAISLSTFAACARDESKGRPRLPAIQTASRQKGIPLLRVLCSRFSYRKTDGQVIPGRHIALSYAIACTRDISKYFKIGLNLLFTVVVSLCVCDLFFFIVSLSSFLFNVSRVPCIGPFTSSPNHVEECFNFRCKNCRFALLYCRKRLMQVLYFIQQFCPEWWAKGKQTEKRESEWSIICSSGASRMNSNQFSIVQYDSMADFIAKALPENYYPREPRDSHFHSALAISLLSSLHTAE